MTNIYNKIAMFLYDNFDEKIFIFLFLIGMGILIVGFLLPRQFRLYKIDLKRMFEINNSSIIMSKRNRYLHALSKAGIFRFFGISSESKTYKKIEEKIAQAGGLEGCTPDIVYMLKIISFIGTALLSTIICLLMSANLIQTLIISLLIGVAGFFIPNIVLNNLVKEKRKQYIQDLEIVELFTIMYLKNQYNVYDLLKALKDTTHYITPYVSECINEYYMNPLRALQNLSDKIKMDEYQLLIDILKQAVRLSGDAVVDFIEEHKKQIRKMRELATEKANKKKPIYYTFIIALPLISVIILWLYPLLVRAMETFANIGNL